MANFTKNILMALLIVADLSAGSVTSQTSSPEQSALLGPEAEAGELNVLQVEAMGLKGPIKTPIVLLILGKTAEIILDLNFADPPVVRITGNGPVHIVGHNLLAHQVKSSE